MPPGAEAGRYKDIFKKFSRGDAETRRGCSAAIPLKGLFRSANLWLTLVLLCLKGKNNKAQRNALGSAWQYERSPVRA
jgi:hypothetical protein